jgi:hypothetical protein
MRFLTIFKYFNIIKLIFYFFDFHFFNELNDDKNQDSNSSEKDSNSSEKDSNSSEKDSNSSEKDSNSSEKDSNDSEKSKEDEKPRPSIYSQFFEKKNIIKMAAKLSEPLRQFFYLWLSLKISENMLGQSDAKSIIGILIVIEIIDRTIADIIDESIENSIENELNKSNATENENAPTSSEVEVTVINDNLKEGEDKT